MHLLATLVRIFTPRPQHQLNSHLGVAAAVSECAPMIPLCSSSVSCAWKVEWDFGTLQPSRPSPGRVPITATQS